MVDWPIGAVEAGTATSSARSAWLRVFGASAPGRYNHAPLVGHSWCVADFLLRSAVASGSSEHFIPVRE